MKADSIGFSVSRLLVSAYNEVEGSQLVEFAVTLPLLIVIAVGIFDFGAAFTVKEKLVNIAQAGARLAASQPSNDLDIVSTNCSQLVSVCAVRDVVAQALIDNGLQDCGLGTKAPGAAVSLKWTITANTGCPTPVVLTIDRGVIYSTNLPAPFDNSDPYRIVATQVTLKYPYKWQFSNAMGLLGSSFSGPAQLTSTAVMQDLN